jgi:hypothetical protein
MTIEQETLEGATPEDMAPARGRSPARAVALALFLAYVFRTSTAALATFPLVAVVGASGIQTFPEGDSKLFEPGALWLLEVLIRERALLDELVAPIGALLLISALASIGVEWLLVRALLPMAGGSLSGRAPSAHSPPSEPLSREAARTLPWLGLVAFATWAARALLVLATVGLAMTARSYFLSARDERLPVLAAALATLVGGLGWAGLSVLHDASVIEVVARGATARQAIAAAFGELRRKGFRLAARYGLLLATSGIVLAAAAAAVSWVDVARGSGWRTLGAAVAHQLAIAALLVLRAAWLSSAIATLAGARSRSEATAQAEAFL